MFKKKMLKNKKLFFILLTYTISHIFLYNNSFYINYINPLFWLIFLFIFVHTDKNVLRKKYINQTLIIALIFFILYFMAGFILGFTKSIYNHTLISIFKNLSKVILPIWGIEIMRYKLIKSNKTNFLRALITLLIIASEINFKALFLSHNIILFQYIIAIVIPIIAKNILYTYLTLQTYYNVPIIISLFNEVPIYLLTLIPYNNWFIQGSFAIIKVAIIYYLFKYFIFHSKPITHFKNSAIIINTLIIITSSLLIFFMLGFFKYQPITILSNSMSPTFERGDVVIYEKGKNISPQDIIVFQYNNQLIIHRVVSVNDSFYITKGDANNTIDYMKIQKEDIKGVYKFHIKYLGYPSIWLREFFSKGK